MVAIQCANLFTTVVSLKDEPTVICKECGTSSLCALTIQTCTNNRKRGNPGHRTHYMSVCCKINNCQITIVINSNIIIIIIKIDQHFGTKK